MKISLPKGCNASQLKVIPNNWKTKKAKITTSWFIIYRFYDPRYPLYLQSQKIKMGIGKFAYLQPIMLQEKMLIKSGLRVRSKV